MKFYLLLIAFSLFFCSTKQQNIVKNNENTIEKIRKNNENEILKIKYFYVEPEIPINIEKDELEIVEVTKNRFLIYEENYDEGVQLKNSIIADIPFNADSLFLSIPEAYLNNAKAYPFLNFKFIRDYPYECFYIFRQRDTIEWHIADELLPEDFVFYKNFQKFRLEQLRNKRSK